MRTHTSIRLLTAALTLSVSTAEAASSVAMWATHAMSRVMRDDAPGTWQPHLSAARGEWEALQIVITGAPTLIRDATLSARSLKGPNDSLIPAPVLLREHYVAITHSSESAPLPPGMYPDALVPQTFPWQPLPAVEKTNQPFWVDVYVPPHSAPGDYSSTLTVTLASGEKITRDYTLHVWNFDLPRLPTLKSSIFMVWRRLAKIHGFDGTGSQASPALQRVLNDYYDMLVEHRLSPHEIWAGYPDGTDPLSNESYAQIEAGLHQHLLQRQAGTIGLPLWPDWPVADPLGKDRQAAMNYVVRYYKICEKLGCADRLYKIFGELDEPNSAAKYALVREWGRFFHELNERYHVKVPLMITEQIEPEDKAWGSLAGSVDIWVPHVSDVWRDMESPSASKHITKHVAQGEQVWTYTALVQSPEEWKAAHGHPKTLTHGQPPVWLSDYPPINYRLLGWLAPIHGITGFTYWDTSFWKGDDFDVWTNNGTYPHDNDQVYNGDGFLIYPARQERHGHEGPVASIRLKWIRESIDDHDYIAMLSASGFKTTALDAAKTFARGFGDWDDDIPALYAARDQLASQLEKLSVRRTTAR